MHDALRKSIGSPIVEYNKQLVNKTAIHKTFR